MLFTGCLYCEKWVVLPALVRRPGQSGDRACEVFYRKAALGEHHLSKITQISKIGKKRCQDVIRLGPLAWQVHFIIYIYTCQ